MTDSPLHPSIVAMVSLAANIAANHPKKGLCQLERLRGYGVTEAQIEIKNGRIVSEKPVQMKMPQGTLDANRLEVTETGGLIRFDGGVVLVLTPEAVNRGVQSQAASQANAQ